MKFPEIKYLEIEDPKLFLAVSKAFKYYKRKLQILPASFTGRNHPPEDRGVGGLKKHIEKLCWYLNGYCEEFQRSTWVKDILITVAFFHDISNCDNIKMERRLIVINNRTIRRETILTRDDKEAHLHPIKSAEVAQLYLKAEKVPLSTVEIITKIIECHMGHWSKDLPQPSTELEKVFAMADYIVSRDEFRLEPKL